MKVHPEGDPHIEVSAPELQEILLYATYWDVVDLPLILRILPGEVGDARRTNVYRRVSGGRVSHATIGTGSHIRWTAEGPAGFPEVLRDEGVVVSTIIEYEGDLDAPGLSTVPREAGFLNDLPADVFAKLSLEVPYLLARERQGVLWTIGQSTAESASELLLPERVAGETDLLRVRLHAALPVPAPTTPPEAILELRTRRRGELLQFRAAMDGLYNAIATSENQQTELVRAKERIEASLINLHRVLDESRIQKVVGGLKAYLSLGEMEATKVLLPAIGAATAGAAQISPVLGGLAGLGLNAVLTFATRRVGTPPELVPEPLRDFAYLYYVESLG